MNRSSALSLVSPPTPPEPGLRDRLQLVPPARIIAAEEDSGEILTPGDLRQYAKFFAYELGHDAARAAGFPAGWYAEDLEHCTPRQAEAIRAQTIELCEEVAVLRAYTHPGRLLQLRRTRLGLELARVWRRIAAWWVGIDPPREEHPLLADGLRRAERLNAFGILVLLFLLLVLAPLFWRAIGEVGQ